jgi:probable rRNA maturation factor
MTRRASALRIAVQNVTRGAKVPPAAKLRAWARHALGTEVQGEVTVRIVDEQESATLNERYRGKQGPTNVLSFTAEPPMGAGSEVLPFGDLVICAAVVAREAREQGKTLEAHWAHMVIHGALHLQGHDHEKARQATAMEAHERYLLAKLGFPDPYSIK